MFAFQNETGIRPKEHAEPIMDISKMLAELRQEREAIEEAIITLERLARGRGKRRGRPPAWLAEMRKKDKPASGQKNRGATNLTKVAASLAS